MCRLFYFLLIIGSFSSCSMGKVTIEVLKPPVQEMSVPVENVVVLNRVFYGEAYTKQYINGAVVSQFNGISDQLVNETKLELVNRLNSSQFVNSIDTVLKYVPKNATFRKSGLSKKIASKVCSDLGVDLIVGIEAYNAEIDTDSEIHYSTPVTRNYGTVRIPYFSGDQSVYMEMMFRTYSCEGREIKIESETQLGNQVTKSASGSNAYDVNVQLGDAGNVLIQAARNLGKEYSETICPAWIEIDRKMYISGSEQMKKAFKLAKSGNWPAATDEWYLLASSNNEKLAKQASFNLIVASEVAGDFKLASEWVSICTEKYSMKKAKEYGELLRIRKEEVSRMQTNFPLIIAN